MKSLPVMLMMSLGLLLSSCPTMWPPDPKSVVALIFCDVTNSLTKEENRKVGEIAADIIDRLPKKAGFKLYPIQKQTQVPTPITIDVAGINREAEGLCKGPEIRSNIDREKCEREKKKERRRAQIQKAVDDLYDRLNKGDDNRTCIINALAFASNDLLTNYRDTEKYDLRVFLISDMIEECNDTPLPGGVVKMDKPDISPEIRRAVAFNANNPQSDNLRFACDLARVKIYCMFPAAPDTPLVSGNRRPNRSDVKSFWGEIFKGCGLENGQPTGGQVTWVDSGELNEQLLKLRPGER